LFNPDSMKVNGHDIFTVTTHKGVLVEKTIKNLTGPEFVPVYHNFDYDKLIGIAQLFYITKEVKSGIYADISLLADIKGFPAIAYIQGANKIYALSVGNTPNKDKTIKPSL
jgi:hypothetical protein